MKKVFLFSLLIALMFSVTILMAQAGGSASGSTGTQDQTAPQSGSDQSAPAQQQPDQATPPAQQPDQTQSGQTGAGGTTGAATDQNANPPDQSGSNPNAAGSNTSTSSSDSKAGSTNSSDTDKGGGLIAMATLAGLAFLKRRKK